MDQHVRPAINLIGGFLLRTRMWWPVELIAPYHRDDGGWFSFALMCPLRRVWPPLQPCVFVLSVNYFRTRKPHKTLEKLYILLRGDVVSDRSSEVNSDSPHRSLLPGIQVSEVIIVKRRVR